MIQVGDHDYPGWCRVIWNAHVRELSDLPERERHHLMAVVHAAEQALRELLTPEKMNIASLGNQVAHLRCAGTHKCRGRQDAGSDHWHIIPRFADDPHFPDPVWSPRRRPATARALDAAVLVRELNRRLGAR